MVKLLFRPVNNIDLAAVVAAEVDSLKDVFFYLQTVITMFA
jgi:hypothetical protein